MRPEPEVRTLAELCLRRARTHAAHPAVADGRGTLTYAELAERAGAVAATLASRGVRPGDRVALQGRNSTQWVAAAFGVLLAGAALVPVGHGAAEVERASVLEALRPVVLLHDDDLPPAAGVTSVALGELPEHGPAAPVAADLAASATALVLSSSGTTGAVKSVPMRHDQLLRMYAEVGARMQIRDSDRLLVAVPLAHSFGFNGLLLVSMIAGAMVRVLPTYDRSVVPDVVRAERLTVLAGPPTIYHDLEHAGALAKARLAIAGGQTVAIGELVHVTRGLGIREIVVGYGMTETCGTVALASVDVRAPGEEVAMTPLGGVDVAVRDDLGHPLTGEPGRLFVRGYNVAPPYDAEAGLVSDGWLDTGDLAVLGADGRLTVVGRRSDMVIVSGFNVHPRDVETVLAAHPGVAQVAVTGVPDRRRGQRLVAFVVQRRAETVDLGALDDFARQRLSAYKVPSDYHLLDELPVTSNGKLARRELRSLAARRTASR
ncbi:AMP-binding protein [Nocardioides sp. YIM 152315]|uniref:class I adenylate-forming enzyme family protein n=1 Tax=Nocardioides sp. YIM 152315 TaxID=3031760 RepID=UPI0023D9CA78|nr:AMP-binding protein [Nocardioides sp. YIM 152315]MDF1604718.1 AMP-binding protein [Nocardioides sp. YIM 152315]